MKFSEYFGLWIKTAWHHAWSQAGVVRAIISFVLPLLLLLVLPPSWNVYVSIIPLAWLILGFLLLLVPTSHRLYRDLQERSAKDKADVEARLASVADELHRFKTERARKPMSVGAIKERLRNIGLEGRKILNGETSGGNIDEWQDKAVAFARKALREHLVHLVEKSHNANDAAFVVQFLVDFVAMHGDDDFRDDCIDDK
jgi:hypothetical protein